MPREAKSSYSVRVRTTDQGSLTYEKTFTITINDIDEFVVGATSDSDGPADSIDEIAANGTTGWRDGTRVGCGRDEQCDRLFAG